MHTICFSQPTCFRKEPATLSSIRRIRKKKQKNPTEWEHMPLLHARRDRPSQSQRANPDLVRVRHDSFFSMRKKCTISRSHSLGVRARRARAHTWDAAEIASRSLGCVVLLPQESTGEENDRVRL